MSALNLGSTPRFPAASTKRGMARAIEIVEWMEAYSLERARECDAAESALVASVFREQAGCYASVLQALRGEVGR